MIIKYPLAKINSTEYPDGLVAKFLGDKFRIQLRHLRKFAQDPSLLCFHGKGLPQAKFKVLHEMVALVAGKYQGEPISEDEAPTKQPRTGPLSVTFTAPP